MTGVKQSDGHTWEVCCPICGEWWAYATNRTGITTEMIEGWEVSERACPECLDLIDPLPTSGTLRIEPDGTG